MKCHSGMRRRTFEWIKPLRNMENYQGWARVGDIKAKNGWLQNFNEDYRQLSYNNDEADFPLHEFPFLAIFGDAKGRGSVLSRLAVFLVSLPLSVFSISSWDRKRTLWKMSDGQACLVGWAESLRQGEFSEDSFNFAVFRGVSGSSGEDASKAEAK